MDAKVTDEPLGSHVLELELADVLTETDDARSLVFSVPSGADIPAERLRYAPGQFLTLRVPSDRTGSVGKQVASLSPTESDLVFARTAASDVLTKGGKDTSQPWENPETGARGSVTPLSQAYSGDDGRTCRDFLASYVNGRSESWLQGAACKAGHGRWEIHTLKPWTKS